MLLFSPLLQEDKDKLAEVVANITKELNWNETTQPFISVDGTAQVSKGYLQKRTLAGSNQCKGHWWWCLQHKVWPLHHYKYEYNVESFTGLLLISNHRTALTWCSTQSGTVKINTATPAISPTQVKNNNQKHHLRRWRKTYTSNNQISNSLRMPMKVTTACIFAWWQQQR